MADRPTAENARNKLSSGAIAHEVGHLFFHYAGLSMKQTLGNNITQDIGIAYALSQMRYSPFFAPDPELPDDFDFNRDARVDAIGGKGYEKTRHGPTYEQLLRIGAKRVAKHLN